MTLSSPRSLLCVTLALPLLLAACASPAPVAGPRDYGASGSAGAPGSGGAPGSAGASPSGGASGAAGGGSAGAAAGGTGGAPSAGTSKLEVTLNPSASLTTGTPVTVSFGVPFPPGVLDDATQLAVEDASGHELPSYSEETVRWRAWDGSGPGSVRGALVHVKLTFASSDPVPLTLLFGTAPQQKLDPTQNPDQPPSPAQDNEYTSLTVDDPAVYATYSPKWLSSCDLRTQTEPVGTDASWSWFDDDLVHFAHTAVNDVAPGVTQLIDYETQAAPWLFDRTLTLYGVYIRTGDVTWLRHAHRAAEFYADHISPTGYFDLKSYDDLKYSYGQSLLVDLILVGDRSVLPTIEHVASAGNDWNPMYTPTTNFWTERHQAYALLAALSAWEATGKKQYADRAKEVAHDTFSLTDNPVAGYHNVGCPVHSFRAHEGDDNDNPVCSPWMEAFLGEAIYRYWVDSEDQAALQFLSEQGNFLVNYAVYTSDFDGTTYMVPWYLASDVVQFSDDGPWGDLEHTCDVGGLAARDAWAKKKLGQDASAVTSVMKQLVDTCQYDFKDWHRPGGPAAGLAEWRLSPPRKFNWWFGTTLDLPWIAGQL